jgi:hypothetical protein
MNVSSDEPRPAGLTIKQLATHLQQFGISFGPRQLFKLLRHSNIIDEENVPLEPYEQFFEVQEQVIQPYERVKATNYKLYVKREGVEFLKEHLKQYKDFKFKKNTDI